MAEKKISGKKASTADKAVVADEIVDAPAKIKDLGIKIVLCEDDEFISRAYNDGFKKSGLTVHIASDGVEGLKMIREELPDLVLLDLIMPLKNGFEVLAELKADKKTAKIPVIILSNLGQDSDIKKGKDMGAIDYLVKANFSMKEIIEKIKITLAKTKNK